MVGRKFFDRGHVTGTAWRDVPIDGHAFLERGTALGVLALFGAQPLAFGHPPIGAQRAVVAASAIEQRIGLAQQFSAAIGLVGACVGCLLNRVVEHRFAQFSVGLLRQFDLPCVEICAAIDRAELSVDVRHGSEQFDLRGRVVGEFALDPRRSEIEQFARGDLATRLVAGNARIAGAEDIDQKGLCSLGAPRLLGGLLSLPRDDGDTDCDRDEQCRGERRAQTMPAHELRRQRKAGRCAARG